MDKHKLMVARKMGLQKPIKPLLPTPEKLQDFIRLERDDCAPPPPLVQHMNIAIAETVACPPSPPEAHPIAIAEVGEPMMYTELSDVNFDESLILNVNFDESLILNTKFIDRDIVIKDHFFDTADRRRCKPRQAKPCNIVIDGTMTGERGVRENYKVVTSRILPI